MSEPLFPPTTEEVNYYQDSTRSHAVTKEQEDRMTAVRDLGAEFMLFIMRNVATSREKSLAMRKIDEAIMYANAAIARKG